MHIRHRENFKCRRDAHCTLADVEVVEHEEGRQVSQLLGTYGAANERARSLPRLRIPLST
jgi:hypothetical protein